MYTPASVVDVLFCGGLMMSAIVCDVLVAMGRPSAPSCLLISVVWGCVGKTMCLCVVLLFVALWVGCLLLYILWAFLFAFRM